MAGGKTTFCRLLRYCLGEDSFAPEGQRRAIRSQFPAGSVGAEILLNGTPWAIVRSLGDRRRDFALENATLEDALQPGLTPTGMRPFREAVADAIIADAAALMPSSIGETDAWGATLAWATRDQECRFGDHLKWRDPNSDSHSPVSGISSGDVLMVVRALIGALSADEIAAQRRAAEQSKLLATHRSKSERLGWQIERSHEELASVFSLTDFAPGTPLACEGFKRAAGEALSKMLGVPAGTIATDLQTAHSEYQHAQQEFQRINAEYEGTGIRIEERQNTASYMRSDLPEARARLTKEKNPICPICEVSINVALAKGCGLSIDTCDLAALQTRISKLRDDLQGAEKEIEELKSQKVQLKSSLGRARQRMEPAARTVAALERTQYERSTTIRAAQRLLDDAERYERLIRERSTEVTAGDDVARQLEATKETLSAHRMAVAESIRYLSGWFDTTMRELVPGEIRATAKLDGNGLTLKVELGGDRSTAAIESLKVVAFDLAALITSIEGRTRFPGFLIHDSPREADLGLSIYSRLFAFARTLETFGPAPLFQYIVTTTTEPPPEFLSENWLRLTVHGGPASERLLRVDL